MNKPSHRYLAVLALSLLLGEARADYWTVDELVEGFNQVSAQIARGELQAAEAGLDWGMYNFAHLLASGNGIAQDHAAAYRWYLDAAQRGHGRAMNFVGRFHENGWSVARDTSEAMTWYQRAARAGDFRGQANYASMLAELGQLDEAVHWLQRALDTGTPALAARLRQELAASPHLRLRELAGTARS